MKFEADRFDESSDDIRPRRKRLYFNDGESTDIILADEGLIDLDPKSPLRDSTVIEMTWPEVEWLYHNLGDLIAAAGGRLDRREEMMQDALPEREESLLQSSLNPNQLSLFKE